jgi:hypothetical protein
LEPTLAHVALRRPEWAERQESRRPRKGCGSPGRIKALKAKSQERHRDETSPDGVVGCKPARACETLRPEGGGRGWPVVCSKGQRSCRKV